MNEIDSNEQLKDREGGCKRNRTFQIAWGLALVFAGSGVFYRIPAVMLKVERIEQFAANSFVIRFCCYLLAVLLIGGGLKKIYDNFQKPTDL